MGYSAGRTLVGTDGTRPPFPRREGDDGSLDPTPDSEAQSVTPGGQAAAPRPATAAPPGRSGIDSTARTDPWPPLALVAW